MTRITTIAVLLTVLSPAAPGAQTLSKEGTGSATSYYTGTFKLLEAGKEHAAFNYEVLGIVLNDDAQGFLHNATVRCMGALRAVKGEYNDDAGLCVIADKDGDQVFSQYAATGRLGVAGKVVFTYTGGTGKYAGITGTGEQTRTPLRAAAPGTIFSVSKGTYKYKLP